MFSIVAVPWFFLALIVLDALGFASGGASDPQRYLSLVIALAPIVALMVHPWLGRLPGFRWLHHRTQPRLKIDEDGLDVQLPGLGRQRYAWDEISALRTRRDRAADLLGRDGVALARIPESLLFAGGTWWRSESVASLVVRARPDRFRLSGANWAGAPNEFALRAIDESAPTSDPWATRRRLLNVGIIVVCLVIPALIILRYRLP